MKKFYIPAKNTTFLKIKNSFLSALFLVTFFAVQQVDAQSQGPNYPTNTGDTGGGTGWTNQNRIVSDNNSYATVGLAANATSQTLYGMDYNFSIPAAATINGIVVTIGRFSSGSGANSIKDVVVRLIKNATIDTNANKADAADWAFSETAQSYGSATDLWGTTWTPAQINSANFGAALQVQAEGSSRTASVDYIRITVYYAVSPTVTSFSPNNACVGTNPTVVITGTNFTGATAVSFNGTSATPFTVNSATQITTTVPAGATTGPISVTTPSGTGTSVSNFTINPYPVVASITGPTPAEVCVNSTIAFACATPGGVWGTSNPSIATVVGGTVTGVSAGTANINYTVTTSGCATTVSKSVTVNPLPVISGSAAVCVGNTVQLSASIAGGTWSSLNANATVDATGLVTAVSQGVAAITYTVSGTNCASTVTFAVNAPAAITAHPNPQIICSGSNTVTFSIAATGSGVSYLWYKDGSPMSNGGNVSGATSNTLTLAPILLTDAANYHCVATGSLCAPAAASNTATLTVVEEVKITAQPVATQTLCVGNSASFSVTATGAGLTYQWYKGLALLTDGGSISGATTPTLTINPLVSGDAASNYRCVVSGTSPCGPINSSLSALIVNDAPSIGTQPAPTQTACSGGSISLSVAVTGGTLIYQWYKGATLLSNGGNISGATSATLTINPTTAADSATDYHCVIQNGCAVPATSNNAEIIINEKPFVFNYTASVCSDDTFNVAPTSGVPTVATIVPAGTKYSWSAPTVTGGMTGGAAGVNQNSIYGALNNPTNTAQTATYTVTPTSGTTGNCNGTPFTVTVTVNPKPVIINSTPSVCSGVTLVVTPTNGGGNVIPAGTTYTWSAPIVTGGMTGGVSGTNQASIIINLTNPTNTVQTASYNVTATSGSCVGSTFTVAVNVNPRPTVAADIPTQTVCSGTAFAPITISNPNNISGTVVYSWTRNNTANLTGMSASGSGSIISGTLTNTTNTQQTTTFTITATSDQSCVSTSTTVNVVVDPIPTVNALPATQTICSGNNITTINFSNPNNVSGTTYTWTRDNNANLTGIAASGSGTNITGALTNTTLVQQITTFTISATAAGCGTNTSTVTVIVNPRPDVAASPATQTVCAGTAISAITITNPNALPSTTISWTRSNTANTPGIAASGTSASITGTMTNPTGVDQTTTFTITTTRLGCASTAVTVDVIVQAAPLTVATPATQGVCTGLTANIAFTTSNSLAGTTFSWTRDNVANIGGLAASGTGNISTVVTNTTSVNQTTVITIVATAPNGCQRTTTASLTVYPTMSTPGIEDSQVVCAGSRPTTFFITTPITGGSGTYTYQWQSSTTSATGPWTNITGATAATYQPPTTTGTTPNTWYQVQVTSCGNTVTSNSVSVVVANNSNFSFSIDGGNGTYCAGANFNPYIYSLHGGGAYIRYSWIGDPAYISPASGGPVGNTGCFILCLSGATLPLVVDNNTSANVNTTISITPMIYDADTNAFICSLSPQTTTITIRPRPVAIANAPNLTICSGTSAGVVATSNISASSAMIYSWTRSANASVTSSQGTGTSGTIATNGSFTIPDVLTNNSATNQSVTYTITPTSSPGGCAGTATTITITVAPQLTPGTIGSNQVLCNGGDPAAFTQLTAANGTGLSYQWQMSTTSATGPWSDIIGATGVTYDAPGPLTQTTWFTRVVTNTVAGLTCSVATTTPVQVSVNNINPGAITSTAQTICSGGDPTILTSTTAATGTGTIAYQWQSNTTGCGGTFTNIPSATGATYDPPAGLAITTYYRRMATSTSAGTPCSDYSGCVIVYVNTVTGGTVGSDETLCGNNPSAFTNITAATGLGTLSYQWQSNTTGCGGTFTNIPGATLPLYDPPAGLTNITYYRRVTTSTFNSVQCTALSNCITVTPNNVTPGVISGNRTVCYGGDPAAFTVTTPATGTSITYQWQLSTAGGAGPWTDIPLATSATYDEPGPITQNTYYQCVVSATLNSSTCSAATNFVTVFVNDVTAPVIAGDQTVCGIEDPVAFTMPTPGTAVGTLSYQWQSSTVGCSGPWTNIPGATGTTYDPPIPTQTLYYRLLAVSTISSVACTAPSNCVTVTSNSRVWTGLVNSDWHTAGNWSANAVPTNMNCVVIPNVTPRPIIAGNAFAYNLTILNGGILRLNSNHSLTVTDAIAVQPTGQFNIMDSGSLVQINNTANTGNINMERITQPMYRFDFTYWGSPLTLASNFKLGGVGGLSPNTLGDKYFSWSPTNGNGFGGWVYETAATVMDPTKGYIVRAPQTFSTSPGTKTPYIANFIGTPNNGDILCPILHGTLGPGNNNDKYNLLGNPYPSAVDAEAFLSDPANVPVIDGTIYFWTHNSPPSTVYPDPFYGDFVINYTATDYASWNKLGGTGTTQAAASGGATPTGYIAAGQGFFAKSTGTAASPSNVVFKNSMRTSVNNNQFFRTMEPMEKHRIWLNLVSNSTGNLNQILVGYAEGATLGWDRDMDGARISETGMTLYSIIPEQNLVIQGRPLPFDVNDQVALGYKSAADGNYSLRIDHIDGLFEGQDIYIEDKLLNIIHDVKQSPYVFTSAAGTFNDRFVLRYTNNMLGVDHPQATAASFVAVASDDKLKIESSQNIKHVFVYDIAGKLIRTYNPKTIRAYFEEDFYYAEGIYMVKVRMENGNVVTQKLINSK
jgi:hypothetical protein